MTQECCIVCSPAAFQPHVLAAVTQSNPNTDNKEGNAHNEVSYAKTGEKLLIKHFTVQKQPLLSTEQ